PPGSFLPSPRPTPAAALSLHDALPICFYFVHSYYVEAGNPRHVVGRGHYGKDFAAALADGSRFAVQFHPEKSHTHGLQLLQNFRSEEHTSELQSRENLVCRRLLEKKTC